MTDFARGPSGVPHRGPAEVWADVLHIPCMGCGVEVNAYCVLRVRDKTYPRHAPCLSRLKAAERQAS